MKDFFNDFWEAFKVTLVFAIGGIIAVLVLALIAIPIGLAITQSCIFWILLYPFVVFPLLWAFFNRM